MISKAIALLRYIYDEHLQGSDILIRDISGKVTMIQLGGENNV